VNGTKRIIHVKIEHYVNNLMILQTAQIVFWDVNGILKNALITFLAINLVILNVLIPKVNSKIYANGIHFIAKDIVF